MHTFSDFLNCFLSYQTLRTPYPFWIFGAQKWSESFLIFTILFFCAKNPPAKFSTQSESQNPWKKNENEKNGFKKVALGPFFSAMAFGHHWSQRLKNRYIKSSKVIRGLINVIFLYHVLFMNRKFPKLVNFSKTKKSKKRLFFFTLTSIIKKLSKILKLLIFQPLFFILRF